MKKILCVMMAAAFLLAGCDVKRDVAMRVGDVDVKTEYLEYFEKAYNNQSGGTVSDAVKTQARQTAEMYGQYAAIGHAMQLDVADDYDAYVKEIEDSRGTSAAALRQSLGISDGLFEFINYGDVYRKKLLTVCEEENNITEEKKDEYFKNNFWRAKHLLIQTQGKSSDEKAAVKKQIEELYAQVKNGGDFDALIAEYNEDPGVSSNPDGYVFTEGEMVAEFQNGVSGINVGEYNLVETSYGYHIVKRLALDETPELYEKFKKDNEEKISQALVADIFDKFIESKLDEYDIQTKDYTGESEKNVVNE
ncbi:MAG: peptidylprolyl isomerase [Clostridia bacterium]|nr:peptidylprolyl isomerase [Clostridia bacterium]